MKVAPGAPSRTAILTAACRALHRQESTWVLNDPLAAGFAGEEGAAMIAGMKSRLSPDEVLAFVHWVCARARFAEDAVEREFEHGLRQYVILGAGLDSFAYRRPEQLAGLRIFEVDHPASQEWKRRRLEELGVSRPADLVFASVDFESESLIDGLTRSGFDWTARTMFSWMGVTMYLTTSAIRSTVGVMASTAGGSAVVMTYNQPVDSIDELSRRVTTALSGYAGEMGEKFVSMFTPGEAEALMREHGYVDIRDFGAEEARTEYFGDRADVPIAGAQRILVARVR